VQDSCKIAAVSIAEGNTVVHEAKFVTGDSYSIIAADNESILENHKFRGLKKHGERCGVGVTLRMIIIICCEASLKWMHVHV